MRWLFWFLGLFAAAVAVMLVARNPGYVQFVYPPYRLEVSLTFFALILLAAFGLGYILLRLTFVTLNLPAYVRNFRAERAANKGRTAMIEALRAYFEGRFAAAEKAAVRAMELGEKSGLNSIVAARAAHELRQFDRRDAYLADAEGKTVGETTMRLMAKTEFLLDQKQPQSALNSLKELSDSGMHKHIGALSLELKAQQQARNWDAVLEVMAQLEKRNAIDKAVASQLRQQAWLEKLRSQATDINALRSMWKSIPGEFKRRSKIAAAAAESFSKLGDCKSAQQLLAESLNANWDSELVALYGECHNENNTAQIEQAESWLKQHTDDPGLLLALGKLCMHQQLWGKAQSYLDASLSLEASREAYATLGQLAEKMGKHEEALVYFQKAM
ncbi:heme biosynthesis protein HemY [Sideroxydans lithotrophicus]|uniref:HemY domain protein n=1 Tax=Sideroxydans lithotrophicus (strain ES-1) TaxID=580332 RepID=D5CLC4_SIDLE|nr:heme biosynthesis protein HemY [Sideroxydans lithotrophicus]ADE10512.1 HemY domain protein [Sideroxydans lithotrophicus ES-1]